MLYFQFIQAKFLTCVWPCKHFMLCINRWSRLPHRPKGATWHKDGTPITKADRLSDRGSTLSYNDTHDLQSEEEFVWEVRVYDH